jgi:peptidoglycan/xylan/chitin deacetylase (PgdA/CDA1 family)
MPNDGSRAWLQDPRERVPYSPAPARPPVRWPGNARVAFWVAPNVEHYEYTPPPDQPFSVFSRLPTAPDIQQYALRDYGNRVGFWRMTELLDELEIPATVSLNLAVLDHYPEIRDAMISRGWALMSHGLYNTRAVTHLDEAQERAFFETSLETMQRHTGHGIKGMLGPVLSATVRTPDLMAEYGFVYSADWPLDDEPVPIMTTTGRLISVPYSYDQNDANVGLGFHLSALAANAKAQFDRLWDEGATSGKVMCLALHPFVIGQPHMIGYLRDVLEHVRRADQVWFTTGDEIADHYLANHYDEHLEHAAGVAGGAGTSV